MKTLLTTFLLTVALSGCATLKPAADAGLAIVEFPQCRMALHAYLPDEIEAQMVIEWENIDSTFNSVIAAAGGDMDMTLQSAIQIAGLATDADLIEHDFMAIVGRTISYQETSKIDAPQYLINCNERTQAAWEGLRGQKDVATVEDYLRAAAPYAKLVPLFL